MVGEVIRDYETLPLLAKKGEYRLEHTRRKTEPPFAPRPLALGVMLRAYRVHDCSPGHHHKRPRPLLGCTQLLGMWQRALHRGKWRMIEALVDVYARPLTLEELDERTGFAATGGTFGTYLGTLRRNGLIEATGDHVSASQRLLLE
jgi:hypothetical protein